MTRVSSWGRLPALPHQVVPLVDRDQAQALVARGGLAHGMGRSYGDVCLNPEGTLWSTTGLDKFIQFDPATGLLTTEAGVLLKEIQQTLVPRGWMLPVTPGTQFVTVGGAIANDVHGKNHHLMGSFGDHVEALTLVRTDGQVLQLDRATQPQWLQATIGGLGLTGVILQATIRLRRVETAWLQCETIPYRSLEEFFELASSSQAGWEYTVSWVDCLSGKSVRGIFMRANHATSTSTVSGNALADPPSRHARSFPAVPPVSLVNPLTLRLFNGAYFHRHAWGQAQSLQHYKGFFYPLDNLLNWNRMYGPAGFFQYQCVLPPQSARDGIQQLIDAISRQGQGSFLAVLKTFGHRVPAGQLSFPMPGVTLALDFPNLGERTLRLFDELDAVVREARGRLYLAKDARMPRDLFEAGYPALQDFMNYRDPGISSALSRRLMGW